MSDSAFAEVVGEWSFPSSSGGESHWEQVRRLPGGRYFLLERIWTEFYDTGYRNAREIDRSEALRWLVENDIRPPAHILDELLASGSTDAKPRSMVVASIEKVTLPAAKDEAMTQRELLQDLHTAFLLTQYYGTDQYQHLSYAPIGLFEKELASGTWGATVEGLKAECVESGVEFPDSVLGETAHFGLRVGEKLPESDRARLDIATRAIYARLVGLKSSSATLQTPNRSQATVETAPNSKKANHQPKGKKLADAISTLSLHPDWTDARIAKEVGCTPEYLSRNARYQAVREAAKAIGQEGMNRSKKSRGRDMDEYE